MCVWVWGVSTLRSHWISKRALKLLFRNPTSSLQSLYDYPFYVNLICPQGITYSLALRDVGGCYPQRHNFRVFQLRWIKWPSPNFDWKLPSNHFRLLNRALTLSISNRKSPFRSFYNNSFDTKWPGLKKKKLCPHRSLLRQRYGAACPLELMLVHPQIYYRSLKAIFYCGIFHLSYKPNNNSKNRKDQLYNKQEQNRPRKNN